MREVKMVKLKTGAEVSQYVLGTTLTALNRLFSQEASMGEALAAIELVTLARDPGHVLFGRTSQTLADLSLVDHAHRMHDDVRQIVLAATEGDDMGLYLVSPIKSGE
ncbi:hypothetical protein [Streptomyces sp. 5-10]|uniref:hypothetical protein n=1 Tax=Streptomyces sp. 5-10 TaxID=878925 RepID=UPI00168BF4AE|nr:hypothetical protein [Streptomyces sp. 5-10]MBD3004772.1 hypothetical protein [Streptomyces sp. 5-10]